MKEKTSKNNELEAIENRIVTLKDIEDTELKGLKLVYLIDIANKRKLKKSTPTLILNKLEAFPFITRKELENRLVSSPTKPLKTNYNTALAVAKAKGNASFTLRDYISRRITALIRYYTASDIIEGIFNNNPPIVKSKNDKGLETFALSGKLIPIKS